MSFNFENPQTGHKFFMKWDTLNRKSKYRVSRPASSNSSSSSISSRSSTSHMHLDKSQKQESFPFTWRERDRLAQNMSTSEILDTSEYKVDNQRRRHRKWKEIRYFWTKTVSEKVYRGNLENCFWSFGTAKISVTQFIMAVVTEYKIVNDLPMESHLRWLYLSLEGGKEDRADWRELFAIVTVMTFFRLIKRRPEELLMKIFNIYSYGGHRHDSSRDDMFLSSKQEVLKILRIPILTDFEETSILEYYDSACSEMYHDTKIYRQDFRTLLLNNRPLVQHWADMLWRRLPSDVRLLTLDEIEEQFIQRREKREMEHLLEKALKFYFLLIAKKIMRGWRQVVVVSGAVNRHRRIVLSKKMVYMFVFWRKFAGISHNKRRRRLLADVMGSYVLKARTFARIKLFNFISLNIEAATGDCTPQQMMAREGTAKLRYARSKHFMRRALHRWADLMNRERNQEIAQEHFFYTLMKKCVRAWATDAHAVARAKRLEIIALENQNYIRDIMIETAESAELLMKLELEKARKKKEEEEKQREDEKAKRLLAARNRAQADRANESKYLVELQREVRRRRVAKEMNHMKKKFAKLWNTKEEEMIQNAIRRAVEYYEREENKLEMDLRMIKIKKAFLAPPSVDNAEREKIISNPKNIVFLYLEAKMAETRTELKDVIPKFDLNGKGYLSYDEFRTVIDSLNVGITANQITQVIEGVDIDKDGYIELKELEEAMTPVAVMGVKFCPWKFYVDPATDVICYHNFETGVKVFEYKMTDEIMNEINKQNLIAEYTGESKAYAKNLRKEDWQKRLENYMAKRIQKMAFLWFGRRRRKRLGWKLEHRRAEVRTMSKQQAVVFLGKKFRGYKARHRFESQLRCTWEKVWDLESKQLFYYNHYTKESVWDRPRLLVRYQDVENPPPWVPAEFNNGVQEYWHVLAGRTLQRKPDGFTICQTCKTNVATRKCKNCEEAGPLAAGHECLIYFCQTCYRSTHSSPFDFLQAKRPNKLQRIDADFMTRLVYCMHEYELVSPILCEKCPSTNVNAAFYCQQCDKKYCRACYRKIHSIESLQSHSSYII